MHRVALWCTLLCAVGILPFAIILDFTEIPLWLRIAASTLAAGLVVAVIILTGYWHATEIRNAARILRRFFSS